MVRIVEYSQPNRLAEGPGLNRRKGMGEEHTLHCALSFRRLVSPV